MLSKVKKIFFQILRFIDVILMVLSPLAAIMLVLSVIIFFDYHGTHQGLIAALEEKELRTTATISRCYLEEHYCFADFVDEENQTRYGKLEWRYYSPDIVSKLEKLKQNDTLPVRYAQSKYENIVILDEYYEQFFHYKGYLYEIGGLFLMSWFILILHPETFLYSLVHDMGKVVEAKWNRVNS